MHRNPKKDYFAETVKQCRFLFLVTVIIIRDSNSTQEVWHKATSMTHSKIPSNNENIKLIHQTSNILWLDLKPASYQWQDKKKRKASH